MEQPDGHAEVGNEARGLDVGGKTANQSATRLELSKRSGTRWREL